MKFSSSNRRVLLPLFICAVPMILLTGIVDYLLLNWRMDVFQPLLLMPLLFLLADETFVVGRTGLLVHHHSRHTQEGLREFLVGNGAKQFEALLPYYRRVITRTLALSFWRWLLVSLLMLIPFVALFFIGGMKLMSAVGLYLLILFSIILCAVLTLLFSAFLYDRLNR